MRGAEDLGGDVCPGPHAPGPGARKGGPGWCPPSGVPAFLLDLARDQQRLVGGIAQAVLWPIGNPGANGKVERLDIRPDQLDQPQTVLGRPHPGPDRHDPLDPVGSNNNPGAHAALLAVLILTPYYSGNRVDLSGWLGQKSEKIFARLEPGRGEKQGRTRTDLTRWMPSTTARAASRSPGQFQRSTDGRRQDTSQSPHRDIRHGGGQAPHAAVPSTAHEHPRS